MVEQTQPVSPRERLIEAAIRLLETAGPDAIQARKLAAEVGASTMAVYTHFGSIPELIEAVIAEGFLRFAGFVAAVLETDNPMADFFAKGVAYRQWATSNPGLYCLMFGVMGIKARRHEQDLTVTGTISTTSQGQAAFGVMTHALDRVVSSGQIDPVDPAIAAGQFLSATHGYVLLEIAGYFGKDGTGFAWVFGPLGLSVMLGLGARRSEAERAADIALSSFGIT